MDSVYSLLGLAFRARKVLIGEEAILKAVRNRSARMVLVATDSSANTKKLYRDKCSSYGIPLVEYGDKFALAHALGKDGERAAVALSDENFARAVMAKIDRQGREHVDL